MNELAMSTIHMTGSLSGAITTYLLGVLGDKYDIDQYPERIGYILGTATLISFVGCCPLFMIAGHSYA